MLQIDEIELNINNEEVFKSCFKDVQNFMKRKQWYGACHATTAVLYAICKVLDIKCTPCIGEVLYKIYFDHSWLIIDDAIYDLAITMPFEDACATGPIFKDIDLSTGKEATIQYGVKYQGLDEQASFAYSMSIYDYLKNSPEINLINLVINTLKMNGKYISRSRIQQLLGNDSWKLITA